MLAFNHLGKLGQLGNQMFQYASLRGIASKVGSEFMIPNHQEIYDDGIGGDESSNSSLVGYWKLDNATTVVDLSSNSNNGTVNNATLIGAGTTDSVGNNDGGLY